MSLTFKARVLLELGAELISSDAVALFELIKNGIDAGSKKITISVQIALQPSVYRQLRADLVESSDKWDGALFRKQIEELLEASSSGAQKAAFMVAIGHPKTTTEAISRLDEAYFFGNSISVIDAGRGMSEGDLTSCYLTVGTPVRLHERNAPKNIGDPIPLGEKGIGRLAAMRLGHFVKVTSGVTKSKHQQDLELDWRPAFNDVNLDASKLDFAPKKGDAKPLSDSGTTILIRDIQSDWNEDKLRELAKTDFAKLADPFVNNFANQFLTISYQGGTQAFITGFQSSLLKHADAMCEIDFSPGTIGTDNGPRLRVTTTYSLYGRTETLVHDGAHLTNTISYAPKGKKHPRAAERLTGSNEVVAALKTLGPFSAKFFWYNRGRLMRKQNDLWTSSLQPFVSSWSGGLLVYRDGFRVYPYASPSDDWLDLDRKALSSSAYKLNRAQIIGYLRLSIKSNPKLQDQTNREGLRDSPEKEALRRMLRQAIISDCKTFLESIDKENKPADEEAIEDIDQRISGSQRSAKENLLALKSKVPKEGETIRAVLAQLAEIEDAWERAKEALSAHDAEIEQYLHLAGVGLMVELIAHELARTTDNALELLNKKNISTNPKQLENLAAQLKTLNKRVRVLDELSIPGRQRKAVHNVNDQVVLMQELYAAKAQRHGVTINVVRKGKGSLSRRVEKGQLLQILDNLLSNSMYWLARRLKRTSAPIVSIEIDIDNSVVRVFDNGPGIPESTGEKVFDAFYTTKPSGEGRGLGLYIARRLALENEADLTLLPTVGGVHPGFALKFRG
jgi:signal transduction histidine kinase